MFFFVFFMEHFKIACKLTEKQKQAHPRKHITKHKGSDMSNPHFLYLPLLLAMALQLFACATFIAPAHSHRRMFTPYTFYLFLLSCGVTGSVLRNLSGWADAALYLRFFCILGAFLFLGEFSLRMMRISVPKRLILYAAAVFLSSLILFLPGCRERGEIFALCLPGIPALVLGAMTLWRYGNRFPEQENVFHIAALAHGGTAFSLLSGMVLALHLFPASAHTEAESHNALTAFSLICTLTGTAAFLTLLKDIRFTVFRRSIPGAWLLPAAYLCFAGAAIAVPRLFARHAEETAYQHVNYAATLLERDMAVGSERVRQYVMQLSRNRGIINLLKQGKPNRSLLKEPNLLEQFATSRQRILIYLTNAKGLCLDSSQKSSSRFRMVGQDLSYSRYFQDAMRNGSGSSISIGSVTGAPSVFFSLRIDDANGIPLGVLTAREDFSFIFRKFSDVCAALVAPDNTVFMTNEDYQPGGRTRWRSGSRWLRQPDRSLNRRYIDGIMYTERPCGFLQEPGWRIILGLPEKLPLQAYVLGGLLVALLWLLPLTFSALSILHFRMRRELYLHLHWRKMIFNNNTSGIFITDGKGNLTDANRTFSLLSGYTTDELKKMRLSDLAPNSGSGQKRLTGFLTSGKCGCQDFEFPLCRKNGTQRSVFLAGSRFHSAHLSPHLPGDGLIWTVTDISGAVQETAALRAEAERFRSLAENSPEQILILDPQGNVLYSNNRETAPLSGEPGMPCPLSGLYDPATVSLFLQMIRNVTDGRRPLTFRYTRRISGAPGEPVLTLLYPIPRKGQLLYIGAVTRKCGTGADGC